MTLKEASRVFDNQKFTDTYGTDSFYGQVLPFPDSVRSGSATMRRILDVSPSISIPEKFTITADTGQIYLVAASNSDYFQGELIRVKYPIMPTDLTFSLQTVGELLASSGGLSNIHMVPSYIRRVIFEDQADYSGGFILYHSSYYNISTGIIAKGNSRYYRIREQSRSDDIGFGVVEAVEVVDPESSVTVQQYGSTYVPATSTYAAADPITGVAIFTEHIDLNYIHESMGFVELKEGDKAISFLKSDVATINVGDEVGDYRVEAIDEATDSWTVHGRPI